VAPYCAKMAYLRLSAADLNSLIIENIKAFSVNKCGAVFTI